MAGDQPPSGGCVLKQPRGARTRQLSSQPPSGGCVLKQKFAPSDAVLLCQPPSGGCVLKHGASFRQARNVGPAAFGRLCVETATVTIGTVTTGQPPSGGCVLKPDRLGMVFRRLRASRLQAAVC